MSFLILAVSKLILLGHMLLELLDKLDKLEELILLLLKLLSLLLLLELKELIIYSQKIRLNPVIPHV